MEDVFSCPASISASSLEYKVQQAARLITKRVPKKKLVSIYYSLRKGGKPHKMKAKRPLRVIPHIF